MDRQVNEKISRYREKLREELNIRPPGRFQLKKRKERPFLASERDRVTVLFGGLTETHERIIKGALEGLGYNADYIPTPDNRALSIGREYCNRGQCNPSYYTVGNLVKYLEKLRNDGVENIEDDYVFITVGSCGPCRLGMYEEEYQKALRAAGFENFRVIMISQAGDLEKELNVEAGLKADKDFYFSLVKGVMIGDLINEFRHRTKPYEIHGGATEEAASQAIDMVYRAFRDKRSIFLTLREAKKVLKNVEVDYTRLKPKVKIIGEFWAQTTEGDGSYRLPGWLEEEGCEVVVEPVSVMVHYTLWWWTKYLLDRVKSGIEWKRRLYLFKGYLKLKFVESLFKYYYNLYRMGLGFINAPLPSQEKMAKLVQGYFSTSITGGEGHLEIAKNILAHKENKAHLVISVKPFGCMPSTQCDGVQVKVMSDYKSGLFIPIETSGDGEVNVKSRIQMKLHEAREKAKDEFGRIAKEAGLCLDTLKKAASSGEATPTRVRKLPSRVAVTAGNYLLLMSKRGI